MSAWRWLVFKEESDGVIQAHAVHAWTRHAVLEDLRSRYKVELEKDEDLPAMMLDLPGMVITTRPIESFDLLGLKLEIPCEDVGAFWEVLAERLTSPVTKADGGHWRQVRGGVRFVKISGFHRILVLTHDQALRLEKMLAARMESAAARANEHMAAWSNRMDEQNEARRNVQ